MQRNNDSQIPNQAIKITKVQHPIPGSVKIDEIKNIKNDSSLNIYSYPLNIEYSLNEEAISILFIGPPGHGKSTFINTYVNHLLGISIDDNIRYKLTFGDTEKEKEQTLNKNNLISIYYVRSIKYGNKLFKLIDTHGDNIEEREGGKIIFSSYEKDEKEKQFFSMFKELCTERIGKLNSVVYVIKSSENRENEFQKKFIKNIINLFSRELRNNFLAISTFTDNDEIPDAVRLLEKMDISKEKIKRNEEWYFSVSSVSYFFPFNKEKKHYRIEMFNFTEQAMENFTKKVLTLKPCLNKETQRIFNLLHLKNRIIQMLQEKIIVNYLNNRIKLKNIENNLRQKIEQCFHIEYEIKEREYKISNYLELKNEIKKHCDLLSENKNKN